ncbi:MAG: hypothetical protein CL609_09110 [Anaerolineaceae bacterium]|nr:hypothetical protein [Anaerolineaceae bacterium]
MFLKINRAIQRKKELVFFIVLVFLISAACNLPVPLSIVPNATATIPPEVIPTSGKSSVDSFINSLPVWSQVAPELPEADRPRDDVAPETKEEKNSEGDLFTCTVTEYNITENPDEIALYNPDAAVLWPGALIRGESHLKNGSLELLAVSRDKRAPLGISIQGGGVLGIPGGVSTVVQEPVGSTIREGINQIVVNTLGADVAVGAGAGSFRSVESYSSTQALLKLGLDARYLGNEVSGRLNYSKDVDEYTYTAYFTQRLFTVAVDLPERPSSFFNDNVSEDDLVSLGISPDNLPLYIDSVSYGRILMFSFTSSDSREQIAAALEYSYNSPVGGVDLFSEAELQETLSTGKIEVFALGGPNTGVQNLIRDGNLSAYFEAPLAINQVEPISFTIRNLSDNRLAKVANSTDYEVRECLPVAGALPTPIHWWTADDTLADVYSDVELGGFGGSYGAGWNGLNASDKAFVLDGSGQYLNTYPVLETVPSDGAFTVSAWINPRTVDGIHTIISQVSGRLALGEFALRVHSGGILQLYRRPSQYSESVDVVQSGQLIPTNQWSYVTAVYGSTTGGSNMRLFINGELVAEKVTVSRYVAEKPRPDTDINMTRIGASELNTDGSRRYPFNGSIDEIMIFDRALTDDEVKAMYQNFEQYKP